MSLLKKIKFENTYFYTRMYDAIATTISIWGQSMILYDGTLSNVFANQNREKLYWLSTKFSAMLFSQSKVDANFNYNFNELLRV
jgi:hemoglobin/transferrin/lactoferrin receptor protein